MTSLSSGQRLPLSQLLSGNTFQVGIGMQAPSGMVFDVSCFGVDQDSRLSDERYFVFYNQPRSPEGAIQLLEPQPNRQGDLQRFQLELDRLPGTIKKIVCAVTLDSAGTMSQIESGYLRLLQGENEVARFTFSGRDFQQERAIIIAEFYIKDAWRLLALGQGFAGGLSALLKHYGGEEEQGASPSGASASSTTTSSASSIAPSASTAPAAAVPPTPVINLSKGIQLEKKAQEKAPHLVSLVKKINVVLEKKQIQDIVAKVVMVMDASGSMGRSYRNGTVQAVVDRISVVAMRMDDDGALETWFYGSDFKQTPDITMENLTGYVERYGKAGGGNNEPPIMEALLKQHKNSKLPVLVVFVTDGGVSKKKEIVKILQDASNYPIFWQFIGIAGSHYGVLEELDTCPGRVVDNANFFAVDDLANISDEVLFERMLNELPDWLKAAKEYRILKS